MKKRKWCICNVFCKKGKCDITEREYRVKGIFNALLHRLERRRGLKCYWERSSRKDKDEDTEESGG